MLPGGAGCGCDGHREVRQHKELTCSFGHTLSDVLVQHELGNSHTGVQSEKRRVFLDTLVPNGARRHWTGHSIFPSSGIDPSCSMSAAVCCQ